MSKQDIAVCGLRCGQTKYQAEQIKKYIEENSLTEIKITILDSESKQKLDKIKKRIADYSCIYNKGFPYDLLLAVNGKHPNENEYLELEKVLSDFKKIIGGE